MAMRMKTVAMYECASWGPGESPGKIGRFPTFKRMEGNLPYLVWQIKRTERGEENGKCRKI